MSAQRYMIEPLSGSDEGDHAVMTFDNKNSTPAVCGVTNTSWSDDYEPPTSRSRGRGAVTVVTSCNPNTSLSLVIDYMTGQDETNLTIHSIN